MTTKVIQADREAAERAMHNVRGYAVKLPSDNHHMVQAFASHADPLRRALEQAFDFLGGVDDAAEIRSVILVALSSGENNNGE